MAHSKTCEAIVLQVHDVGEADRFCILLTREYGRLAARARGVRKPKSRMGGSILPLHIAHIDLHEGSAGFLITGVQGGYDTEIPTAIHPFMQAVQGIELLLKLIEDGEELPEIFDLTKEFISLCESHKSLVLPFTIRLLVLLGLLPKNEESDLLHHMTEDEKTFFLACTKPTWSNCASPSIKNPARIQKLCENIVGQQNSRELRAAHIAKTTVLSA